MAHPSNCVPLPGLAKGRTLRVPHPGETFAVALREHRLSEREAAERLGLSPTEIHRMVSGERRVDLARLEEAAPAVAGTFYDLRSETLELRELTPLPVHIRHLNATVLHGRLAEQIRASLVDGSLSPQELREVAQSALAASRELQRLAADAMRGAA